MPCNCSLHYFQKHYRGKVSLPLSHHDNPSSSQPFLKSYQQDYHGSLGSPLNLRWGFWLLRWFSQGHQLVLEVTAVWWGERERKRALSGADSACLLSILLLGNGSASESSSPSSKMEWGLVEGNAVCINWTICKQYFALILKIALFYKEDK